MRMVVEKHVNFSLGFLASLPPRDFIMKATYPYYTTKLIWIVPPGRSQSALQKLLNPMGPVIWTFLSVTFFIGLMVIAYLKLQRKEIQNFAFGRQIQSPGMNFINVILGNSLHKLPGRNFSRFLLIMFTLYCFVLRSSYQGGLVKFMQLDTREPKLATTEEILDKNYKFHVLRTALAYLDEMPTVKSRASLMDYVDFNKELKKIKQPNFEGVFLTTKAHLAYRNFKTHPYYLDYAPEPLFSLNIVIYLQKDSCLKRTFDDLLVHLISSGLINKWASKWINQEYLDEPETKKLEKLSLQQLEGAFQLLISGLTMALIAFIVEICMSKFTNLKKLTS